MSDTTRNFGRVITDLSIYQAAKKCHRAAITWGGSAMVFVARDGECRVIATGTADAQRAFKDRPDDLVGTYNVCGVDATYSKRERDQIAGDIWHHMKLRANQLEAA